ADKEVPVTEGSSVTTTERYMETYKNVSQDIHDQLNAEAEAVQIILTGIDNDIYSTVDAYPNACEMWKAIERLKQGESINVQDLETNLYWEFGKFTSRDVNELRAERIAHTANPLALVAQQQSAYHPQNHPTHYTQNSLTRSQQAATRNKGKAIVNSPPPIYDQNLLWLLKMMKCQRTRRHVARECQKPKRAKDAAYHRKKMLLCKQEEAGIQLNAEQANWRDDTDDESEDQEPEAHYMYVTQIQEVTPDAADNSGPIFNTEPLQKVSNDDNYNVFAIESAHSEQSKSVHDNYPIEQDEHNVIIDSLNMSYDREQIDQNNDDDDDLANERELLASLIEKLKYQIDDNKNRNKFLETSNKVLVDKLKGEIEDFKNKYKSLESSNNHFKEANNKLSETNALLYNDLKKFKAELDKRNDVDRSTNSSDVPQAYTDLKISKKDWFKDSPKLEELDPNWNTVKTFDDTPKQPWLNEMIQAQKPPLTFDKLMSTPMDFSAFSMNRLKLNNITRADLVGPVFNLLKGTYKRCVELEYNMEECYRALTYQLD
nr:hypothetical protein [Tanacetum cinerariifolium]